MKKLAGQYGFTVVEKAVTNGTEMVAAANLIAKDIDIYYAIQDNTVASYFAALLDVFNKSKIPVLATNDVYSNAGGLISQGTTDYNIGYRSGEIAAFHFAGIPMSRLVKTPRYDKDVKTLLRAAKKMFD